MNASRSPKHVVMMGRYVMGTWPGDGWLREAPRPRADDLLSPRLSPERLALQAELKKCIYIPAPGWGRRRESDVMPRESPKAHVATPVTTSAAHDPIVVGLLLALLPPIGLTLLWTSPRYTNEARRAITMMTALMMLVVSAVLMVALATS